MEDNVIQEKNMSLSLFPKVFLWMFMARISI